MMPPQDRDWGDVLGPDRDPAEVIEDTKRLLGLDAPRVRHGDGLPDVHGLAGHLGLVPGE
jgi:hypothetical protein